MSTDTYLDVALPMQKTGSFKRVRESSGESASEVKKKSSKKAKPRRAKDANEPEPPSWSWPDLPVIDEEWSRTASGRYWKNNTLGTSARPAPGTRLRITARPEFGHGTATHGVVEAYDGRWFDTQFPVRLYTPGMDNVLVPTGQTLMFATRELGSSIAAPHRTFWPCGFELIDGEITDTHPVRGGGVQSVTLLARRPAGSPGQAS